MQLWAEDIQETRAEFSDQQLIESFQRALLNHQRHRLDPFQLFRQSVIVKESKPQSLSSLRAELLDADFQVLEELNFSKSKSYFVENNPSRHLRLFNDSGFSHYFHIRAASIVKTKNRILWTERDFKQRAFLFWIDTSYLKLGDSEVPVFRIPFKDSSLGSELSYQKGKLFLGKNELPLQALEEVARSQYASFQFYINILNFNSLEKTRPWLESFFKSYHEHLGRANEWNKAVLDPEIMGNFLKQTNVSRPFNRSEFRSSFQQKAESLKVNIEKQNSLIFKMRSLGLSLTQPRPAQIKGLKNAFLALAVSVETKNTNLLLDALSSIPKNMDLAKIALFAGVGFSLASYPNEFLEWAYSSAYLVSSMMDSLWGRISEFGIVTKEAITATFSGFRPQVFGEAYLFDGNWKRTLFGLSMLSGIMVVSLGVPHIMVNAWKLSSDLYKELKLEGQKIAFKWTDLKKSFIERQQRIEHEYVSLLIEGEKKKEQSQKKRKRLLVEELWIQNYLRHVEAEDFPRSKFSILLEKIRSFTRPVKDKEAFYEKEIQSFSQALSHFLFSFASLTQSGSFFVNFWNSGYVIRALVFKPRIIPYIVLYPRYFSVALQSRKKNVHIPSDLNGGKDSVLKLLSDFIEIEGNGITSSVRFSTKEERQAKQERRRKALQLEKNLEAKAIDWVHRSMLTAEVFDSGNSKVWNRKIQNLTDKALLKEALIDRSYLYWAYKLYMERFVKWAIEDVSMESIGFDKWFEQVSKSEDFKEALNDIKQEAERKTKRGLYHWENFLLRYEMRALKSVSPDNSLAFERFNEVKVQMKKPLAMARAIRSTVASILVDRPIELVFLLFFVAGVEGDLVRPIHQEMNGPNSLFYLSKYHFFSGYLHGMITGFLYETWMKLQYDARLDHTGVFANVPQGENRRLSFRAYYLTNLNSEDNTWWKNQWYISKLAWANMGVATLSYAGSQLLYLGRVDLDLYFAGYLMFFFSPFAGIFAKLENAFEKSANWVLRDIPSKYHKHPSVVKYSERAQARLRFRYNLWFAIYENSVEYLISNLKSMESQAFGTRGFSRWLLGGYTFTELAVSQLDKAEKVPLLEKPARFCRELFTKNFTDWKK
jgi:hypothetical protein